MVLDFVKSVLIDCESESGHNCFLHIHVHPGLWQGAVHDSVDVSGLGECFEVLLDFGDRFKSFGVSREGVAHYSCLVLEVELVEVDGLVEFTELASVERL